MLIETFQVSQIPLKATQNYFPGRFPINEDTNRHYMYLLILFVSKVRKYVLLEEETVIMMGYTKGRDVIENTLCMTESQKSIFQTAFYF